MKYRAVAVGVLDDGHPVQILAQNRENLDHWIAATLAKWPACKVEIWVSEPKLIETVKGPGFK